MASLLMSSYTASLIPNLASRVFVVTGGTAGIGFGIVTNLLAHNAERIYILSDGAHQADLAKQALAAHGDVDRVVEWVKCDLADLNDVDHTARRLARKLDRLDALVCNAGVGVGVYKESADGIDTHFQINHLAQMHLVLTLLPNLLKTAQNTGDARLVFQSSDLHRVAPAGVKFKDLAEINEDIGPSYLYNRSKLAQICFMRGLRRRLNSGELGGHDRALVEKLFINCTNPGAVSTTQQDQAIEAYGTWAKLATAVARLFMKDPVSQGCLPALWAATDPDVVEKGVDNQYIVPPNNVGEPTEQARSEELETNLWALSERLLREKIKN